MYSQDKAVQTVAIRAICSLVACEQIRNLSGIIPKKFIDTVRVELQRTSTSPHECDALVLDDLCFANWTPSIGLDEDNAPTLTSMPADIMGHILYFLVDDLKNVPVLLSLKQTCRSFRNFMAKDEVWETLFPSYENILQYVAEKRYADGSDGVDVPPRKVISSSLHHEEDDVEDGQSMLVACPFIPRQTEGTVNIGPWIMKQLKKSFDRR